MAEREVRERIGGFPAAPCYQSTSADADADRGGGPPSGWPGRRALPVSRRETHPFLARDGPVPYTGDIVLIVQPEGAVA